MKRMRNLVFNYKKWYCKVALILNLFTPLFVLLVIAPNLFVAGGVDLSTTISGSFKTSHLLAILFCISFVFFSFFYTIKTCAVYRNADYGLDKKGEKARYDFLVMGIVLNLINVLIMVLSITVSFTSISWLKYLGYILASCTVVIGIFSNVFIHLFEAKSYSLIFCKRHIDTDIKDVVRGVSVTLK